MKNIFKVMGVALLACSMIMVSCKKDENEDNNNTIADGINVTFDGQSWTAAAVQGSYNANYNMIDIFGGKTSTQEFPIFDECIEASATAGTYNSTASENDGQAAKLDGIHNWVEYYETTSLTDGQNSYGDWWAKQATTEITSVDLTALTISAKMNGTMFSAWEAYTEAGGGVGMDGASTAPYSVTCGNISLSAK